MPKAVNNYDLSGFQLLNVRLQNLASAPGSPTTGQIYYDTVLGYARAYDTTAAAWGRVSFVNDPYARANHTGTQSADTITSGSTNHVFTATMDTKLAGIATGATANSTDAVLEARANHTGTQTASTISDLASVVQAYRLDQFAAPTADLSINTHKLTNVVDPTSAQDAATKNYVDNAIVGLSWKAPVVAASTATLTLSGAQTIDGISVVAGNRVLVKNQSTASANGIYVAAAGAWSRATDFDGTGVTGEVSTGAAVFIQGGTAQGGQQWVLTTTGAITVGTTSLTFTQFGGGISYTAGNGISLGGNAITVTGTTGISVTGSGVGIDTTVVPRYYKGLIGDGSTTAIAVTHGLGSQWVNAQVFDASTGAQVWPDITCTSSTVVTFTFGTAPASNAYRVVVVG